MKMLEEDCERLAKKIEELVDKKDSDLQKL